MSEYNRDQWLSLTAIRDALAAMSGEDRQALSATLTTYLEFRLELAGFQARYFQDGCRRTCYTTELSVCCGFESIITFFADQIITCLLSRDADIDQLVSVLERPNTTGKCVFLGDQGCRWRLPPIGCAMFYCDSIKAAVFAEAPEARVQFEELRAREKQFTHPDRAVLFDDLECLFRRKGLRTPHMYYHFSPGLVRLKAKAGILDESLRIQANRW